MVNTEICKRIGCKRLVHILGDMTKVMCWHKYCPTSMEECCYECTYLGKNRPKEKGNPNRCVIEDKDMYFRFIFAYRKEKRMHESISRL